MARQIEIPSKISEELEESISRAMERVNVKKETDLCRYLPGKEGRLHHFAFSKLKRTRPIELVKMVREYILENEHPQELSSKPRPGLMLKRLVEVKLKRAQINRLVDILKKSGDHDLIATLSPHQTLGQVQKLMLEMIRMKEVDLSLWETYVRLVEEERNILS